MNFVAGIAIGIGLSNAWSRLGKSQNQSQSFNCINVHDNSENFDILNNGVIDNINNNNIINGETEKIKNDNNGK